MDDEDDRHLLDIIGDVQALNDYLHGSNKSIEEEDVSGGNAAGDFFTGNTASSEAVLKDGPASLAGFGEEDSGGAGLQLSNSLAFIENELGDAAASSEGADLEDQPFDILQKSLMEADITEQTLAQEALLDSQPAPAVQPAAPFPSQLVSGGYSGGPGRVATATAAFPGGQFLQGVSQLPNGSAGHIQVVGSFGGGGGVMMLRPGAPAAGQVFAPSPGQVGLPFKNIPLQNIILRGPGGTQTLVRPIQPKPLQSGAQTVYSLGIQPSANTVTTVTSASQICGQYTANGSIVVHSPQQGQGQYLLPSSLALTPATTVHTPADQSAGTLMANQSEVQLIAGQNFTATAGGQLIVNQSGQVGGAMSWSTFPGTVSTPTQASSNQGRLTLVGPPPSGQVSGSPVQRLLVTQTTNSTSMSPLSAPGPQEQDFRQESSSPSLQQDSRQLGMKAVKTLTSTNQESLLNGQVSAQKRPASQQLTRAGMMLQQLRKDHSGVLSPDYTSFTSLDDAINRLLPYHVFQGTPPSQEEFSFVDDEFESVATQVLNRTQAMVNKYRRLLLVEAERSSPSSEIVMIDRTFNQEERQNLTQDRRMLLVDPDAFLEDFCCGVKPSFVRLDPHLPLSPPSRTRKQAGRGSTTPPCRTDPKDGYGDPGGGEGGGGREGGSCDDSAQSILDKKRTQQRYGGTNTSNNSLIASGNHHHRSPSSAAAGGQTHYQESELSRHSSEAGSPPPPDTDSVLEAAVNSILEC